MYGHPGNSRPALLGAHPWRVAAMTAVVAMLQCAGPARKEGCAESILKA